jgi:hypothetical protein
LWFVRLRQLLSESNWNVDSMILLLRKRYVS